MAQMTCLDHTAQASPLLPAACLPAQRRKAGFEVWGLRCRVEDLGMRVQGLWFRVQVFMACDVWLRADGLRFMIFGLWSMVYGS